MKIDYTGVERPMTKADKSLWVEALRSGNYEQGRGELFNGESYCCLGVAQKVCEVETKGVGVISSPKDDNFSAFLPFAAQEVLYVLSDDKYKSFPQIADYIESLIPAVDE